MDEKQGTGFFFEILVVVTILGSLSAIAFPYIGQLVSEGKIESSDSELHNIQTAVVQMLSDSDNGTLKPIGPTADMNQVQTSDSPPLVLTGYLTGLDGTSVKSGCNYTFAADGTVIQIPP
jgi:type II secretory pathway pseudopilin PulG